MNIISEIVLSLVSGLLFGFMEEDNDELQWTIICAIIVGFMANITLLTIMLTSEFLKLRKSLKNQSTKVICEAQAMSVMNISNIDSNKHISTIHKVSPVICMQYGSPEIPATPDSPDTSFVIFKIRRMK